MDFLRGIIALLIWAILGPLFVIVGVAVYTVLSWQIYNAAEIDRQFDIEWWRTYAVAPLVVTSIYLGLAAWATDTPKLDHGVARTLALLASTSFPMTWLLTCLELTPKRVKIIEHPDLYPSEFLLLFLPPFLISCILIAIRWPRHQPQQG